jgi:hypothetical protein
MTKEELQAIKDRCEKATPGSWVSIADIRPGVTVDNPQNTDIKRGYVGYGHLLTINKYVGNMNDAEFIANARQDIPALLEEIERLLSIIDSIGE